MKLRWRFGIIAGIFLAVFCLYPQLNLMYLRGDAWNGHYAYNDIDEVAYASYVRALIDGRPRKNDPYSGRDDRPEQPQPESLFSIQFAAPYTIALPARIFGFGAPWAMTLSGAAAGFLAALAGFWLVFMITRDNWFAMAASLAIFAGGALAAGEGALPEILFDGFSYPYFPGFRRYIPAMAMPAIFALFGAVWALLRPAADEGDKAWPRGPIFIFAGACFAYTVFSYFYIWTTAAAWLGSLFVVWTLFRPEGFRRDLKNFGILGAACAAVLIPYAWLLSRRSETMDDVQLLVYTHAPDIWRVPLLISVVCILLIAAGAANRLFEWRSRSTLFVLATSLVPLIVFNQQVITGRSLQPIHYQVFIGNYVTGLALLLTIGLLTANLRMRWPLIARAASAVLLLAAIVWGTVECYYTVRVLDEANIERDLALPVARRLEELAASEPNPHRMTVLSYDGIFADDMPTVAPQNILWARHQHVFAGLTWHESKERYYQYLYYSNVDEKGLDWLLTNDFVSKIALFGWGRHTDRLSADSKPLTYGEIAEEVARYGEFRRNFDTAAATRPMLSFVVINNEMNTDLTNLDAWYERYAEETIGKFTIFRVRIRAGN
ncbi:MAG: hypothetical protein ABI539_09035 [Acidobacteriota bacterium]